jgi:hypothetical protein
MLRIGKSSGTSVGSSHQEIGALSGTASAQIAQGTQAMRAKSAMLA